MEMVLEVASACRAYQKEYNNNYMISEADKKVIYVTRHILRCLTENKRDQASKLYKQLSHFVHPQGTLLDVEDDDLTDLLVALGDLISDPRASSAYATEALNSFIFHRTQETSNQ